jgi:hypothetical protein
LPLSKIFRPSSTWFISRIFPRGEVTDSHYNKLYYRHGPNHTCPRGAQLFGPNRTWTSLGGEGVGGPVDFGGAFVLSRMSEGGRIGLRPVSALGLSYGFSLRLRKAGTKSMSEGWRVRLRPNNHLRIPRSSPRVTKNKFIKMLEPKNAYMNILAWKCLIKYLP